MKIIRVLIEVVITLTIIMAIAVPCNAQFSNLPDVIKTAKRSSLSIESKKIDQDINKVQPTLLGSAFLVKKDKNAYAVTNAHVVANIQKNQELLVGANLKEGKCYLRATLVRYEPLIDVAIISLGEIVYYHGNRTEFDQAFVGVSLFSPDSTIKEGTGVLVIGYPLNIGVESNRNQPVSRIGIVAQSVTSDGTFLIDGNVSHGNSGSPVFNSETQELIGMVAGFKGDQIDFLDNSGNLLARLPHNSGISLCISAASILKLIP